MYRMERAFEMLIAAEDNLKIGQYKTSLNRSYYGLYVPQGLWRQMENFSTNSLALILASTPYIPDDYI